MSVKVVVCLDEPIGTIHPNIYGHFTEHLGSCIYEGIWVGEDSKIANTMGIRNDVVAALKRINPPILRWPGGNFADDYHWQDGVGPRAARPRRVNMWWDSEEPNQFGTHEFVHFCRMIGAEPYLCGNVGSSYPRELRDWVEYCNYGGDTTLARQRAANGAPEPFKVRYWGVGNENWAAGGSFEPEDYAIEYKRFATYMRDYSAPLYLVACGAYGEEPSWTQGFFSKMVKTPFRDVPRLHGFGVHYYCGTAGTATEYSEQQWYQLLAAGLRVENVVNMQRAAMDSYDPLRKVGLVIDEWGTWHPPIEGRNRAHLWQQNTMRDALVAALTLDVFNRHADKVVMANIAQTVNVLQALILTDGPKMVTTPTYHVYDLYQGHQGGRAVRSFCDAPAITFLDKQDKSASLPGVAGSASVKNNMLTISLVNTSAAEESDLAIQLRGGTCSAAAARILAAADIHTINSFERPDAVTPRAIQVHLDGNELHLQVPAASVAVIRVKLV
ncbi:MAG: alpha-N-arabinofuranosidase [Chloroflexi bacterium]|nr:alpha-N-arabinofuranosidase [Chloroflexota bacterium]